MNAYGMSHVDINDGLTYPAHGGVGTTTNGIVELGKLQPYENLEPLGNYNQWVGAYPYLPDDKMIDPTAQYMYATGIDKNFYGTQLTVSYYYLLDSYFWGSFAFLR